MAPAAPSSCSHSQQGKTGGVGAEATALSQQSKLSQGTVIAQKLAKLASSRPIPHTLLLFLASGCAWEALVCEVIKGECWVPPVRPSICNSHGLPFLLHSQLPYKSRHKNSVGVHW